MKAVEALAQNELNERLLLGQLNVFEKLGFVGESGHIIQSASRLHRPQDRQQATPKPSRSRSKVVGADLPRVPQAWLRPAMKTTQQV